MLLLLLSERALSWTLFPGQSRYRYRRSICRHAYVIAMRKQAGIYTVNGLSLILHRTFTRFMTRCARACEGSQRMEKTFLRKRRRRTVVTHPADARCVVSSRKIDLFIPSVGSRAIAAICASISIPRTIQPSSVRSVYRALFIASRRRIVPNGCRATRIYRDYPHVRQTIVRGFLVLSVPYRYHYRCTRKPSNGTR